MFQTDLLACCWSCHDWIRWAIVEKCLHIFFMLAVSCMIFLLVKLSTSDKSEIDLLWLVLIPHCLLGRPESDTTWLIWSDLLGALVWPMMLLLGSVFRRAPWFMSFRWSQEGFPSVSVKFFLVKFKVGCHLKLSYIVRSCLVCFLSKIQEKVFWVYLCCSWGKNTVKLLLLLLRWQF